MIPVSYCYTSADIIDILDKLAQDKIENIKPEALKVKSKAIEEAPQIFQRLIPYATSLADAERVYGFRRLKQFEILLMSNALLNERTEVTEEDFEEVKSLFKWINLDFNPL